MSNDSTQPMNKEKIAQAASRKAAFETQTFKPENKENKKNKLADIVVGLDGSDESFAALRWAMEEARHTGQRVNAVFGWTRSWDMGEEPQSEADWSYLRKQITAQLSQWAHQIADEIGFDIEKLDITSKKASGSSALIEIGKDAQQIVVGRRTLSRVARWFFGSVSANLVNETKVPVTIVHWYALGDENEAVSNTIATQLQTQTVDRIGTEHVGEEEILSAQLPVVVGIDGSECSMRALQFALDSAAYTGRTINAMFCWQMKTIDKVLQTKAEIPSKEEAQKLAEKFAKDFVAKADIPQGVKVETSAFHITPQKGLLAASHYASRIIMGSRGLKGFNARFLGSVSRYLIDSATCTTTIVH